MRSAARRHALAAVLATLAALGSLPAGAAEAPAADAAERTRIASERRAVEDRFEAARRDCATRFTVNDCLATARAQRREALAPLQQQLHLLDDARRRERAVERLRVIREREAAVAAKPALEASAPAASAPVPPPAAPRRAVRPATAASAAAAARQRAAAQAQRHAQRQQQAREHAQAVQARNARRDAKKPPAAGLPVPVSPASTP